MMQNLYSNTTLVKVKYIRQASGLAGEEYSNTTLVKVKFQNCCPACPTSPIQIQLLLKLNKKSRRGKHNPTKFKYNSC